MKKIITQLSLLFFIPTVVMAGIINFDGGTWTIIQIHGDPIEVVQVDLQGGGIMLYKTKDGKESFVSTSNVKNLGELEQMAAGRVNNEKKLSPDIQRQYNEYAAESDRLGKEIARRERELDQKLKAMATGHDQVFYFSSRKYCKQVSSAAGGSYQIEQGCLMNEKDAEATLKRMNIPTRIVKYCENVSDAAGGSYQIMLGCVQNELDAKRSLN